MSTSEIGLWTKVRLVRDIERFPHFIAREGSTGTVTYRDSDVFCVRMDETLPGAEEWDNEVVWSLRDGEDPSQDITRV